MREQEIFERLSDRRLLALQARKQDELMHLEKAGPVKRGAAVVAKLGVGMVGAVTGVASFFAMHRLFLADQHEKVERENDKLEQAKPASSPEREYFGELHTIEGKLSNINPEETIVVAPCRECFCAGMGGVCRPVAASDEREVTVGYEGNKFRRLGAEEIGRYLKKNPQFDEMEAYQNGFDGVSPWKGKFNEIQERLAASQQMIEVKSAAENKVVDGCCEEQNQQTHAIRTSARQSQSALARQTGFAAGTSVAMGAASMTLANRLAAKLPQNRVKTLKRELSQIENELGYRERVAHKAEVRDSYSR